jgi:hypothetical protein
MREIRFKYNIPGFKCRDSAVKNRKMFENKGVAVRASNAGRQPRPVFAPGVFFGFGPAIQIFGGWGGWGWHPGWGNRTIIVNNTFVTRYNFNTTRIVNEHGSTVWNHDAFHRQGVPYTRPELQQRYQGQVRENLRTPQAHNFQAPASERMGNRQIETNNSYRNRSAFGGIENGAETRAHIDHGYPSLGPARSGGGFERAAPAAPRGNVGGGRRR